MTQQKKIKLTRDEAEVIDKAIANYYKTFDEFPYSGALEIGPCRREQVVKAFKQRKKEGVVPWWEFSRNDVLDVLGTCGEPSKWVVDNYDKV